MDLEFTDAAKEFLVEKSYDEKYGARPLRRALQKFVEDELSEQILKGILLNGIKITADLSEDKKGLYFNFSEVIKIVDETELESRNIEIKDNTEVSEFITSKDIDVNANINLENILNEEFTEAKEEK
jgi:ATP-dependent Clp protease ATP-binding subunit ClpC